MIYHVLGLGRGAFRFRRGPLPVATDPSSGEVVATFAGEFEPVRRVSIFGTTVHQKTPRRPRATPLAIRRYSNVIVLPGHNVLSARDHSILPPSFAHPHHLLLLQQRNRRDRFFYRMPPAFARPLVVREPVFLAQAADRGFGHTLVETVPMLEMLDRVPESCLVAVEQYVHLPLLAAAGLDMSRVLRIAGPVYCERIYAPDPPFDLTGNMHPLARRAFSRLAEFGTTSSREVKPRVYLSRGHVAARRLANEGAVEALFERRGFEVVHPERLSLADQIHLVATAEMVAGPAGSAMHLMLAGGPATKVLVLCHSEFLSGADVATGWTDNQYGFVIGTLAAIDKGQDARTRGWSVDLALVEQAIEAHFGL